MADVQPEDAGRRAGRRTRGTHDETRLAALQRLRRDRNGGGDRQSAEVKMEDTIYDTVKEDDPDKKDPATRKPTGLSDAATLMGKKKLSSMFNSSVFKKNKDNKVKNSPSGSLVDDLIAKFARDEADLERRRRARLNSLSAARSQRFPISMSPPSPAVDLMRHNNIDRKPSISSKQFVNSEEKSDMGNESNFPMEIENGQDLNSGVDNDSSEVVTESQNNGSLAADDDDEIQANAIKL